jgi:SAM-dependent methyltransferase
VNIHRLYALAQPFFRRRRLRTFLDLLRPGPATRILDVGGNPWNWNVPGMPVPGRITLLNLHISEVAWNHVRENMTLVQGSACALPFADGSFDIVFSNSVIEHVGGWDAQQAFAREVMRVGRRFWVQTPAQEFLIEPHFLAPCFHWLPRSWRLRLARHGTGWGWITRPTAEEARSLVDEIRLLRRREMTGLFPGTNLLTERVLGWPKSYVAWR